MSGDWIWPASLGTLGVVFGSFIAVLAVRWPAGRSAAKGRSRCDVCDAVLSPVDLVPVVSWLILRGRCRRCGGRIAAVHPACEALGGGIGIAAGLAVPGWEGVAGAAFGWLLLALAALDLAAFWLPDRLTALVAAGGIGTGLTGISPPLSDRLIGGAAGYAVLAAVAFLYHRFRGRIGLGGGDPKLFGAIGLWLGWRALPLLLFVACAIGLGVVMAAWLRGRPFAAADRLPLGTLLAAAAFPLWCLLAVR